MSENYPEQNKHTIDRDIRRLALPSLGSLLAEPLLVAVDSAMVGHLGTVPLAGLALASTVLTTLVGLCIFLAYATTAATARLFGAGKKKEALRQGIDGMWLALGLGVLLAIILIVIARPFLGLFGPRGGRPGAVGTVPQVVVVRTSRDAVGSRRNRHTTWHGRHKDAALCRHRRCTA